MPAPEPAAARAVGPLIALISATPASAPAILDAFSAEFPAARLWQLLDDRLLSDAVEDGGLTVRLEDRMSRLIAYAVDGGADGVLLTCSLYGPVAERMDRTAAVPIQSSDGAVFDAIAAAGCRRVVLVSSTATSAADTKARFTGRLSGTGTSLHSVVVEDAYGQAAAGDTAGVSRSVAAAVSSPEARDADAVLLTQYSLAPASDAVAELTGLPVFEAPSWAARSMRRAASC